MGKTAYGYVNCAFYNIRAEGDRVWFATRAERDEALERIRAQAIRAGLSETAAEAGIYPVKRRMTREIADAIEYR